MRAPGSITTGGVCLLTVVAVSISVIRHRNSTPREEISGQSATKEKPSEEQGLNDRFEVSLGGLPPQQATRGTSGELDQRQKTSVDHAEVFNAFKHWSDAYLSPKGLRDTDLLTRTGESLAIQRRRALVELIETNPELALEMAVSVATHRALPASIAQHLEEHVAGSGRLEVIASVSAPGEQAPRSSIDRIVTLNDRRFKAFVYGRRANQPSMESIPLHGIALGGTMAVHESPVRMLEPLELAGLPAPTDAGRCPVSSDAGSPSVAVQAGHDVFYLCDAGHILSLTASYIAAEDTAANFALSRIASAGVNNRTQGEKSVLLMRLNFPDDSEAPISEAAATNLMQEVKSFYARNSYGTLNLSMTVSPLLTLPQNKTWYATNDELMVTLPTILRDARAAAAAAGLAEPDFDIVFLKRGILSNSRAKIGDKGAWLQSSHPVVVAHELGHNLGLWHANAWQATDGSAFGPGRNLEYGNAYDTMGSGTGGFNAFHKSRLNWLPDFAVQTITESSIYRLYPADVPSLAEGAIYALKIRKDHLRDYWIESRNPLTDGLLVNWSENPISKGGSQLLDMTPASNTFYDAPLRAGETFYDPIVGFKILPLGPSADPRAVDVMVKRVHYIHVEAENGLVGEGWNPQEDATASLGAYLSVPDMIRGGVQFQIDVPETDEYVIWARTRSSGGAALVTVAIDGAPETAAMIETIPMDDWHWSPISSPLNGSSIAKRFTLSSGRHIVRIAANQSGAVIDCLLVTNDLSNDLPPAISSISDQVSVASEPIHVSFSVTEIGATGPDMRITVQSLNQRLAPDSGIILTGSGMNRILEIKPSPNRFGTVPIVITAINSDGTSASKSFALTLVGPVQAMVDAAAPGDTIILAEGNYIDQVILDKDLTLEGTGPRQTVIDGNRALVPLTVTSNATVVVRNLTLRRGLTGIRNYGHLTLIDSSVDENLGSANGGGIWNAKSGTLLLHGSTISSNRATLRGAGIYSEGELTTLNSTISGNRVSLKDESKGGGGIFNIGVLQIQNSTITANHARIGGGVVNEGVARMRSSIVAGNNAEMDQAPDYQGALVSEGFNLMQNMNGCSITGDLAGNIHDQSPSLAALNDNGGPTLTHALLPDSPAIDEGSADGLSADQRGYPRHMRTLAIGSSGDGADIGAFEYGAEVDRATARLSLLLNSNGEVTVQLTAQTGSYWTVAATSDFLNWETLGVVAIENGVGQIIDEGAGQANTRFYRAMSY